MSLGDERALIGEKIRFSCAGCLMNNEPAYFYILGDPYERFAMSKIGITRRLEARLLHIFSQGCRLPDGIAVFSLYVFPDWQQAAQLESVLLRVFHDQKANSRTLAWIALKPSVIDLRVDLVADAFGLDWTQIHFPYRRWNGEQHASAWRKAIEEHFELWLPKLRHNNLRT
ncbi:MAG: hypothetical protein ACTS5Y_00925 [Pollutimonas bauzanensis]